MKRKLILCPEINSSSFVLLFERGTSGASWSVRDYSEPERVSIRYAREFAFDIDGLFERTIQAINAPAIPTSDVHSWHRLILETNARFQIARSNNIPSGDDREHSPHEVKERGELYVLLDPERLNSLPKARKEEDMRRMLHSPNSEDWVTWNAFAILGKLAPDKWWTHLVELAQKANPMLILPKKWQETPAVSLWRCVPSPHEYEASSRVRMRTSGIPDLVSRSQRAGSVEGESEIDICLRSDALTVFVEAKLGSDVSLRTKYDPSRNQIVRNIDCLIDEAGATLPVFWMLVRDSGSGRAYSQLLASYRENPSTLMEALPHRNPSLLAEIAGRLSLILWKDLMTVVAEVRATDEVVTAVYQELLARVR
jgi:hypothetical protein